MTLLIRDQLVNPPTWFSSFRDLTLYCHIFLKDDILIESEDPDRGKQPQGQFRSAFHSPESFSKNR